MPDSLPRRRARLHEPITVTVCVDCLAAVHDCICEPDGGPEPKTIKRRYIAMTEHRRLESRIHDLLAEAH